LAALRHEGSAGHAGRDDRGPDVELVGVMSQKLASLVYVLKAAADKKNAA
jgi:hypothetical protein